MLTSVLLPLILGTVTVLQGALNRRVSAENTLPSTVLLNSSVLLVLAVTYFWISRMSQPQSGSTFHFRPWYLLPGVFGFLIVTGIPWGIQRAGALKVFLGMIAAQLVVSLLWDAGVELKPVTLIRAGGSLMAFLSAALVIWKG